MKNEEYLSPAKKEDNFVMPYIGKDGKEYYDRQSLNAANQFWFETMFPKKESKEINKPMQYIGYDGQIYESEHELSRANYKYFEELDRNYDSQIHFGLDGKVYGSAQAKDIADIKYMNKKDAEKHYDEAQLKAQLEALNRGLDAYLNSTFIVPGDETKGFGRK